jgi:hypothetical protein
MKLEYKSHLHGMRTGRCVVAICSEQGSVRGNLPARPLRYQRVINSKRWPNLGPLHNLEVYARIVLAITPSPMKFPVKRDSEHFRNF